MSDHQSFDYVIVGSGPSAIGLVYGLLQAHVNKTTKKEQGRKNLGYRSSSSPPPPPPTPPPTIAIIERGSGPPHHPTTSSPRNWYQASHCQQSSSVDLIMSTITGRIMEIPVGKGIGGTSNINAGLCHPPTFEDCSGNSSCWPEPWRSSLYKEAQSLQQTLENNNMIYNYRSIYCNSGVEEDDDDDGDGTTQSNLQFFPAVKTLAQPTPTKAVNHGDIDFRRTNYYGGLLEPFLKKHPSLEEQSIHWFRGYEVQRILLDDDGKNGVPRILGVECTRVVDDQSSKREEQFVTIRSIRRTIVCAGALETPALLLVSFREYVDEDSILLPETNDQNTKDNNMTSSSVSKNKKRTKKKKKKILAGVGKGLKDQTILGRIFLKRRDRKQDTKRQILSTNGIADLSHLHVRSIGLNTGDSATNECFQIGVADKISYSFVPATLAISLRWHSQSSFWSTVFEWLSSTFESFLSFVLQRTPLGTILDEYSTATLLCFMHPKSSGSVRIAVKDTYNGNSSHDQQPLRRTDVTIVADPGYLSDSLDLSALRNAWEHYGQTFGWEIFPGILFSILLTPLKAFFGLTTKSNWFEMYCRSFLLPYFHFAGSCSLQPYENVVKENVDWVVESSRLQLRGFEGISICDASVFPSMVSNPPALTCATMGYILGENLAGGYP